MLMISDSLWLLACRKKNQRVFPEEIRIADLPERMATHIVLHADNYSSIKVQNDHPVAVNTSSFLMLYTSFLECLIRCRSGKNKTKHDI